MADIAVKDLHKYYGANHILKGISFEIYEGERVGLLGKNGAGKTTLFKVLTNKEPFEEGQVFIPGNRQMEALDQIPVFPEGYTVQDVLDTGFDRLHAISEEMKKLEADMTLKPQPSLVKRYGELQTRFEVMGGYTMQMDLAKVTTGLLIDSKLLSMPFNKLSGGERTRVNLGRIILKKPDILLLDEPTNHLDMKAVEWLEEFLASFKGTVVVISHDRYFLDQVVTRIIEIEDGKGVFYNGNYTAYVKEREERFQKQLSLYEQEQRKIRHLEEAAKRMHDWAGRADNKALHKRAFAMEKRIEWLRQTEKPVREKDLNVKFKEKTFSGKDIIVINDVGKSYGTHEVIKGITIKVQRGDRIGLLGPNGCGKTTLLNLIANKISPDSGQIRIGKSVKYAFLPQIINFEKPEMTMLETVRYAMEWSEDTARNRLAAFHFTGEEVFKKVKDLSGGEKSRLKLFLLMQDEINLLILDEPTNHLDIASREWIERAVESYGGTLLFVSHDRYFINKFANRIWDMKDGQIADYEGNYEEYRQWSKSVEAKAEPQEKPKQRNAVNGKTIRKKKENQKKLDQMEQEIIRLETLLEQYDQEIEAAAADYVKLQELLEEKEKINHRINELYEDWSDLSEDQYSSSV